MRNPVTVPLLSAEEEESLATAIDAGVFAGHLLETGARPLPVTVEELRAIAASGEAAWHRFLLANVRLVWKLAGREARRAGLPAEELFQEGFLAMAEALRRFDAGRSRFSTFASIRIRRHLAEAAAGRLGQLGLPAGRAVKLRYARGLASALDQERGRSVDVTELASELGQEPEWARRLLGFRPPLSIDTADEALTLADPFPVDPDQSIYAAQVRRAVRRLEPEQATVLSLRYGLATGEPVGIEPIAARLGISASSVRRLERRGLDALRELAVHLDPAYEAAVVG